MGYTLRPYQLSGINNVIRQLTHNNQSAVVFATGSGKTDIATIVGSELLHNNIVTKVIAATPFTSIVNDFSNKSGDHFTTQSINNRQFNIHKIENCFSDDDSNDKVKIATINHIIDVIKSPDNAFIVSTHAAIASNKIINEINSHEDLSNALLIIDEAHHCYFNEDDDEKNTTDYKKSTKLGELAKSMLMRGAKILYLTATPYRTNGARTELIFDSSECNPVIRTIGEQMRDGYSPKLKTEYLQVDYALSGKCNFFGDTLKSKIDITELKTVIPIIAENYINDDYPKAIWLIPAGNAEESSVIVKQWIEANIKFPPHIEEMRGRTVPKVLLAIGKNKKNILDALSSDKCSGGREYDIILGCRKFDEGTDVPSASHLYMIGLPSNVRLFHQRVGRVVRMKPIINGYREWFGEQYLDNSKIVFIAPIKIKNGTQVKIKQFDYNVSKQLLHCIFASESYIKYCEATNINHSIRMAFESIECETQDKLDDIEHFKSIFSDLELTMIKNYANNEFEMLSGIALNPHETIGDKYKQIQSSDLSVEKKRDAYTLLLSHLPEDIKASNEFQVMITDMVSKMVDDTKRIKIGKSDINMTSYSIICSEFEHIIERYKECEVSHDSYKSVNKVFTELTSETISEWADRCMYAFGEEAAKKHTRDICEFIKLNNKAPTITTDNQAEKTLYRKLVNLREAKKGNSNSLFYPSLQEIAEQYGYPDLFSRIQSEEASIQKVVDICEFIKLNNRTPTRNSNDSNEKSLATKLSNFKLAVRGANKSIFYPSLQIIAEQYGYPTLFDNVNHEENAKQKVIEICEFIKLNNKMPSGKSKDLNEKILGVKLLDFKRAKKMRGGSFFYPSLQIIAEQYGYPTLFDNVNRDENAKQKVIEICEFIKLNNRIPSDLSKSLIEKSLSYKLTHLRKAINFVDGDNRMFYASLQIIAEQYGYPTLFDNVNHEENAKQKVIEICEFIKLNNRIPSQKGKDLTESKLGIKLSSLRQLHKHTGVCSSLQEIAEQYGYPDLFNVQNLETNAKQKVIEICEFIKLNNRTPSQKSKNLIESKLGAKLSKFRQCKADIKKGIFYPSLQLIAEQYGHPDLFEIKK